MKYSPNPKLHALYTNANQKSYTQPAAIKNQQPLFLTKFHMSSRSVCDFLQTPSCIKQPFAVQLPKVLYICKFTIKMQYSYRRFIYYRHIRTHIYENFRDCARISQKQKSFFLFVVNNTFRTKKHMHTIIIASNRLDVII